MAAGSQTGRAMKQLLLIGIGPGDPRQVTYEAVDALKRASVFFVLDKGTDKDDLLHLRKAILERYRPQGGYRLVQVEDLLRDGQAADYVGAVRDWHQQRAALYARLLDEQLQPGDVGAFLLWESLVCMTAPCASLTWCVSWVCCLSCR